MDKMTKVEVATAASNTAAVMDAAVKVKPTEHQALENIKWGQFFIALVLIAGATAIDWCLFQNDRFHHLSLSMIYLLFVTFIAMRYSLGPAVFSALLSVACFDYFFVPPYFAFGPTHPAYLFSEAVMLIVSCTISGLAHRLKSQVQTTERAKVNFETERMRTAILSSVSHDLRTPLASITGAASTLLDEGESLPSASRTELLNSILNESERMNRLVRNLLDMTRIEAGAMKVKKEWCSIEEIVGAAIPHFRRRLHTRKLKVKVPADLPLIEIDEVLIEQVLINLLDNAIKYSPPDSEITIEAKKHENWLVVSVTSQGQLLSDADLNKIFDRFVRGPRDTTASGFGLGLAICAAIIKTHGGKLWAEAKESIGNIFYISLPIGTGAPSMEIEK
jgi:K+-sensing histidine kinase KdpD